MTKERKHLILQIVLWVVYIGMLALFSYLSLRTGTLSTQDSTVVGDVVADVVENTTPIVIDKTPSYYAFIRKFIGHYSYFVGLGLVSFFLYNSMERIKYVVRLVIHFVTGFAFAFITEYLFQMITPGRAPSMVDTMIDYGGFCTLSVILAFIFFFAFNFRKKNKDKIDANS